MVQTFRVIFMKRGARFETNIGVIFKGEMSDACFWHYKILENEELTHRDAAICNKTRGTRIHTQIHV